MATATGYDGFISYSHHYNRVLGAALQAHLERFARPWRRPRSNEPDQLQDIFVTRLTGPRPQAVGTGGACAEPKLGMRGQGEGSSG
jgi:hypothetical protein